MRSKDEETDTTNRSVLISKQFVEWFHQLKQRRMNTWPQELIEHTLQFLPVKDKFAYRRVCKRWKVALELSLKKTRKIWFISPKNDKAKVIFGQQDNTDDNKNENCLGDQCADSSHHVHLDDQVCLPMTTTHKEIATFIQLCPALTVIVIERRGYFYALGVRKILMAMSDSLLCLIGNDSYTTRRLRIIDGNFYHSDVRMFPKLRHKLDMNYMSYVVWREHSLEDDEEEGGHNDHDSSKNKVQNL